MFGDEDLKGVEAVESQTTPEAERDTAGDQRPKRSVREKEQNAVLTQAGWLRLAARAGVIAMNSLVYDELRGIARVFLEAQVPEAATLIAY